MTSERPGTAHAVPTLTEEVTWAEPAPRGLIEPAREPVREPPLAPARKPVREPPPEPAPAPERDPPAQPAPPPERDPPAAPRGDPPPPVRAAAAEPRPPSAVPAVAAAQNEDEVTQRILADLQRQVDLVLEYRVREVLTPILTRATDALVRDARTELTAALREVVARSVAQELQRQRSR